MGAIGEPLVWLVLQIIDIYIWVVIIGIILSWLVAFNVVNTTNRFVYTVGDITHRLTEPALKPLRNMLPNLNGIDLSPMALILGLIFLQKIVVNVYNSIL
ncbi:MAG: YggT family protein [Rhodospirillales bacterium]|jgi:YggT family protein|nr:YggT family protein [Rhodospirillales bacterium]